MLLGHSWQCSVLASTCQDSTLQSCQSFPIHRCVLQTSPNTHSSAPLTQPAGQGYGSPSSFWIGHREGLAFYCLRDPQRNKWVSALLSACSPHPLGDLDPVPGPPGASFAGTTHPPTRQCSSIWDFGQSLSGQTQRQPLSVAKQLVCVWAVVLLGTTSNDRTWLLAQGGPRKNGGVWPCQEQGQSEHTALGVQLPESQGTSAHETQRPLVQPPPSIVQAEPQSFFKTESPQSPYLRGPGSGPHWRSFPKPLSHQLNLFLIIYCNCCTHDIMISCLER